MQNTSSYQTRSPRSCRRTREIYKTPVNVRKARTKPEENAVNVKN
nr:MAG TPA: hypothetical protein [Caudoviricetes sp.]